jgi:hypothetical protein
LKQQTEIADNNKDKVVESSEPVEEKITHMAQRLFPHNKKKRERLITRLRETITKVRDKDVLVIHSPGGWGNADWETLQDWEKSIVTGVTSTLEKLGYNLIMIQYFRSGDSWGAHVKDSYKEAQFFLAGISHRAEVMAEEVRLILQQLPQLKIVLVGASQGASFNNATVMKLGKMDRLYSIELGTFFSHMRRRQLTENNLAIDSNGFIRDPMCNRDLWAGFKAYMRAFVRWSRYRMTGQKIRLANCINTPGHEYRWEFPEVSGRITEFLKAKLGEKLLPGR